MPDEVLPETIEQKFVFPLGEASRVSEWLSYVAAADPRHARGILHTVYFDSTDLRHYAEKRESDFLKTKLRLRWYVPSVTPRAAPQAAFLEVKRKFGGVRRKQRTPVPVEACRAPFDAPALRQAVELAADLDYRGVRSPLPVLHLSYERRRFVEAGTGARLSLDTAIGTRWVNDAVLALGARRDLTVGVLEVKSPYRHLPRSLEPLAPYLRKSAFSKYAECAESYAYPLSRRM
jgi:hypothetical protein